MRVLRNLETSLDFVSSVGVGCMKGAAVHDDKLCTDSVDVVEEVRCLCFLVGVFIVRGFFVFYPVITFCFQGVIVITGFGILHEGCGFWRQERIETVPEVVKTAFTGTGEVCAFIALF